MSERVLKIETFRSYDDIVKLSGRIHLVDVDLDIPIPENRAINLHNFESKNQIVTPRTNDMIVVKVTPTWSSGFDLNSLSSLVIPGENPFEVLSLRIFVVCERTRWCSEHKKVDLSLISRRALLSFEIPLNEVKGILTVHGAITRETEGQHTYPNLPFAQLTILSSCKELSIQIDEVREIGGQYFPIKSGNTGDLAFDINGLENSLELPRIVYSEELREFLTRDDLPAVNASMLTSLFFFFDQYLKWFVFTCRYDQTNKYHRSLVDFFSKFSNTAKEEIISVVELEKYCPEQTKVYIKISMKLFRGSQSLNKYKKELKVIYKNSLR